MIPQYNAVGIQTRQFSDVEQNLNHISSVLDMACTIAGQELPVRLVCLAESAIQGFPTGDPKPTRIPGPETEFLGRKARELDTYIVGQLLFVQIDGVESDRLFNCAFIVSPAGEVIYRRAKSQVERIEAQWTTVPHDVWDAWVDTHGEGLNAFFPVVETEIGKIGCAICMERGYPEVARGLAMNGAEIITMPTFHEPFVGNEAYEVLTRARAIENCCYVISPNSGAYQLPGLDAPFDICGGVNLVVDYKGTVIGRHATTDDSFVAATVDVEAMRHYREHNLGIGNFLKDLRTEQFRMIYERPIYPKNMRLKGKLAAASELYEEEREILRRNIQRLQEWGTYVRSSR